MKKLILTILCMLSLQAVNAQTNNLENNYFLGGSLHINSQNNLNPLSNISSNAGLGGIFSDNTDDIKSLTFGISPYIGKEINQKLYVGLQLNYRLNNYTDEDYYGLDPLNPVDYERNSNQFGIGIFTRHILNPENMLNFYIQPYAAYNMLNQEELRDSNTTSETKANYFELGAQLGAMYNISNKVRATLHTGAVRYVNGSWEIENTDTDQDFSSFNTTFNLSNIALGFEIKF